MSFSSETLLHTQRGLIKAENVTTEDYLFSGTLLYKISEINKLKIPVSIDIKSDIGQINVSEDLLFMKDKNKPISAKKLNKNFQNNYVENIQIKEESKILEILEPTFLSQPTYDRLSEEFVIPELSVGISLILGIAYGSIPFNDFEQDNNFILHYNSNENLYDTINFFLKEFK